MKAAAVFFVCLFLSLLNGSAAHANGHDTLRRYSAALHVDSEQKTRTLQMRLASLPVRNNHLTDKKESLNIDFDDDDEQEDFIFARKYVMPPTYFITLATIPVLSAFYPTVENRLPFCAHFSYTSSIKYITQRVLRI